MKKTLKKKMSGVKVNTSFNKVAEIVLSEETKATSCIDMLLQIYGDARDKRRKVMRKINAIKDAQKREDRISFVTRQIERLAEGGVIINSVAEYERLRAKANSICSIVSTGYSMGEKVTLSLSGNRFFELDNRDEYARSCKYSAKHGLAEFNLSLRDLRKAENVDGVWTIRTRGRKCKYLAQAGSKNTHSARFEKGFLVGRSHGKTLREAERLNRLRFIAEARFESDSDKGVADDSAVYSKEVSVDRLKSAGACTPGIKQALSDLGIVRNAKKRKATGYALLKLAKKKNMESTVKYWIKIA